MKEESAFGACLVIAAALIVFWVWWVSVASDCESRGGTMVRTLGWSGYECVKVQVVR